MKILLRFFFLTFLSLFFSASPAQTIFWTENFGTGCNDGTLANGSVTTNGTWTMTSGVNGTKANTWYISASENGNAVGACGTGCGTNKTLHVGPIAYPMFGITADGGARYYAGGIDPSNTDRRIETPTINCTGRTSITLRFKYMENGEGTIDDASVWYYNGSTWTLLSNPAKTALTCNPQGIWTAYSIALPASADNNANVKIGFLWVNDDNMNGTDPSFAVDDITLEVPASALPGANFSSSDTTICQGSCINFNDLTTNAPTSWSWTFTGATPNSSTAQNPTNICYNTAGTYTVTLVANNASGPDTETKTNFITVVAPPSVSILPAAPSVCAGNSVTLTASGATSFQWSPAAGLSATNISNPVATPTATTTYTVTGTTSGCTGTASVVVTYVPNPSISVSPSTPSVCAGNSVTLTASGASSFQWSPAAGLSSTTIANPVATPTATTTYTVTGTTGSCTGTTTVVVTYVPNPSISVSPSAPSICSGNSVTLTATGGTTYAWSPATGLSAVSGDIVVATPSSTITYTVTGTTGSCTGTTTVVVTVAPALTAFAGNDSTICNGASVQLNATGGATYQWSPATGLTSTTISNPVATPSISTTYTVTVSSGTCTPATDIVIITVDPVPVANAGNDVTICNGDTAHLNATGGGSYQWSPATGLNFTNIANPEANPTVTTTYTVTVTLGICTDIDTIIVNVGAGVVAFAGNDTSICDGLSVTLNASGGTGYQWNPAAGLSATNISNPVATPTITTTYTVTVTSGSCTPATDDVIVTINPAPVADAGTDVTICNGDTAFLNATGGGTYQWSPASGLNFTNIANPEANPTITTTYTVTVTLGNCTDVDTVVVNVGAGVVANAGSDMTICNGFSTTLNASGGTTYQWSPATGLSDPNISNPVANPTVTTTYTVTVTSGSCTPGTDDIIVTVIPPPAPVISGNTSICAGGTTTLTASGGTTYVWNTGDATPAIIVSPLIPTTYTVTASNGSCTGTATVAISITTAGQVIASPVDTTIIIGQSVQLTATGGTSWSWQPSGSLSCANCQNPFASPTTTTTYIVTATDAGGCLSYDTVIVNIDITCGEVFVPSAFSPNGDGNNDVLHVRGNCIEYLEFAIYDRWGEKVFVSVQPEVGWDGTFRGKNMDNGVFVYYLKAIMIDGSVVNKQGNITLIR